MQSDQSGGCRLCVRREGSASARRRAHPLKRHAARARTRNIICVRSCDADVTCQRARDAAHRRRRGAEDAPEQSEEESTRNTSAGSRAGKIREQSARPWGTGETAQSEVGWQLLTLGTAKKSSTRSPHIQIVPGHDTTRRHPPHAQPPHRDHPQTDGAGATRLDTLWALHRTHACFKAVARAGRGTAAAQAGDR